MIILTKYDIIENNAVSVVAFLAVQFWMQMKCSAEGRAFLLGRIEAVMSNTTLDYYNKNADAFVEGTVSVDFTKTQDRFLCQLREGSRILDFGCGSGRDTKYFLEHGFRVDAADGSKELCRIASQYTGIEVKQMLFQELDEKETYDGIWACSSILHLPKEELKPVLRKMADALVEGGLIYTSFKYGEYEGERNGRFFTDFIEETFLKFLRDIEHLKLEEYWITGDVRPGRGEERWLNVFLRKI